MPDFISTPRSDPRALVSLLTLIGSLCLAHLAHAESTDR